MLKSKSSKGFALSKLKGFTLIELLVVIAIIGILSSVVLTALNRARGRGQDAKMKSEMTSFRGAAELYYTDNGSSYSSLFTSNNTCTSVNVAASQYLTSIAAASAAENCFSGATGYAIAVTLPTGALWCIDYLGNTKTPAALGSIGAADFNCN